ncbi:MAG TPA: LysM peptidoglycan-binding domain-containing protein [Steroidobacter sp.]|uniref:LysM peptidoglycan-binding domain-containing protein n=1 Tax=Steroidobacter sp. TaxID=1978227 RepID=UPI002ED78D1E
MTFQPVSSGYQSGRNDRYWSELTYVMRSNEDLTDVAQRYGITVDELLAANPNVSSATSVRAGQEITIPVSAEHGGLPIVDTHGVQGAQSMQVVADQYGVPVADLENANPQIPDFNVLFTGDTLAIPAQRQNAGGSDVATAVHDLQVAQGNLEQAQRRAANGDGATRVELREGTYQNQVTEAEDALRTALENQIEQQAGADPTLADIDRHGADIRAVYAQDPLASEAIDAALVDYKQDREVEMILDDVTAAGDTREQLEALSQRYQAAPDEIRSKLVADPRATDLFEAAAQYANEPLSEASTDPRNPDVLPQTNSAITRLDEITEGLDPQIAAGIVNQALPEYENIFQQLEQFPVLGFNGTQTAVRIADRVWSASNGSSLVSRLVDLGTMDVTGVGTPVFEGAGPAYLIELGREGGSFPGDVSMFEYALSGAEQFRDSTIADHTESYAEHMDELRFLVENGGAAMSPEQLDDAIQAYVSEKGPEWENRLNELRSQLSTDGTALLNQVQQLEAGLSSVPADQQESMRQRIAELLSSPEAQLAVGMALNQNPPLVRGAAGDNLVQTFADLGIVGKDNGLAVVLVSSYLRENVMGPAANIDLSNPASVETMRTQLEDALRNNSGLATVLQITPDQLNDVADGMLGLLPEPGAVDQFEYANNVGRNTNNALDKLDASLGRSSPFNLAFRTSAVAIVGSGLVDAVDRFGDDPRLRNGIDVVLESARVGVDSTQLFAALRNWPEGTGVSALKTAGKFVHVLGATMAGADGLNRLGQGDYFGASLSFVVAGGVTWGALGSSAVAGPLGFGAAALATVGLWIYDGVRQSQHANRFQTDTTANFLEHAGFDADAAHVLNDHSGEGYSVVPLLMRYGELKGLDARQTVEWVNSIDNDRLGALRDNLHRTLDEIDGDVSRFEQTHESDSLVVPDTEQRPWFAASGAARPMSVAQLDAVLTVLEVRRP